MCKKVWNWPKGHEKGAKQTLDSSVLLEKLGTFSSITTYINNNPANISVILPYSIETVIVEKSLISDWLFLLRN